MVLDQYGGGTSVAVSALERGERLGNRRALQGVFERQRDPGPEQVDRRERISGPNHRVERIPARREACRTDAPSSNRATALPTCSLLVGHRGESLGEPVTNPLGRRSQGSRPSGHSPWHGLVHA